MAQRSMKATRDSYGEALACLLYTSCSGVSTYTLAENPPSSFSTMGLQTAEAALQSPLPVM